MYSFLKEDLKKENQLAENRKDSISTGKSLFYVFFEILIILRNNIYVVERRKTIFFIFSISFVYNNAGHVINSCRIEKNTLLSEKDMCFDFNSECEAWGLKLP